MLRPKGIQPGVSKPAESRYLSTLIGSYQKPFDKLLALHLQP